jgi:hypothetical protein
VELDLDEQSDEVLGADWDEPLLERLWQALLRRPLALPIIVLVTLLGAGSLAAALAVLGPQPAELTIRGDGPSLSVAPWQVGDDLRPAGPVVLSVGTIIRRSRSGAPTSVVGISGPGVIQADNPAVDLRVGAPVSVPLRAVVDCGLLPAMIPKGAYGIRIWAHSGVGTNYAVADAGAIGESWSAVIRTACASWLARRSLTVTALTAAVDPTRSVLRVSMTVTNSGAREGILTYGGGDPAPRLDGDRPIRVPPHGVTTARFTLNLDTCDSVPDPADETASSSPDSRLTTRIGLVGLVGPTQTTEQTGQAGQTDDSEGFGPTGIPINAGANRALGTALSRACAGLGPIVTLIGPGSVGYDRASRVAIVRLQVDVPPGRVRTIRLHAQAAEPPPDPAVGYRPLWTSTADLTPDRTGQVRVTLRYRVPPSRACPRDGGYLPGFIATLRVPVQGGERVVSYGGTIDLGEDPEAMPLLCS